MGSLKAFIMLCKSDFQVQSKEVIRREVSAQGHFSQIFVGGRGKSSEFELSVLSW
jgi:hypothetical protein